MASSLPYQVLSARNTGETYTNKYDKQMHVWELRLQDVQGRQATAYAHAQESTDWSQQIGQQVQGELYRDKQGNARFKREYQQRPQNGGPPASKSGGGDTEASIQAAVTLKAWAEILAGVAAAGGDVPDRHQILSVHVELYEAWKDYLEKGSAKPSQAAEAPPTEVPADTSGLPPAEAQPAGVTGDPDDQIPFS